MDPDPASLEAALQRLKESAAFSRAGRQFELLRFLIEHAELHEDSAKEAYIGAAFYNRPGTYDPRHDSVVRVNVKRLRSRLDEYYETEGKDARQRITIPLGSYRPMLIEIEGASTESSPSTLLSDAGRNPISSRHAQDGNEAGHSNEPRWFRNRPWIIFALIVMCAVALFTWRRRQQLGALPWAVAHNLSLRPLTPGRDVETDATISPDGQTLAYVNRQPGSVHFQIFLRPASAIGETGRPLDTGSGDALLPAWSPDGTTLAFMHCGLGPCDIETVSLAGGATRKIRSLIHAFQRDDQPYYGNRRHQPIWSADGKSLIFPDRDSEHERDTLVRYDLATGHQQILTPGRKGDEDFAAAPSPDGRFLAFVRINIDWNVMTLDLRTGEQRVLAPLGDVHTDGLSWSPDGKGVVLSVYRDSHWTPLWVPLEGSPRALAVNLPAVLNPTFIHGGHSLMATSVTYIQNLVAAPLGQFDTAPAPSRVLFRTNQHDILGSFSPDGSRLAFISDRSGRKEIWIAEVTAPRSENLTSQPTQLTHNLPSSGTLHLSWAPNSKSILVGLHGAAGSIALVNAVDGSWSLLTVKGLETVVLYCPVWSADGKSIYASAYGVRNGIFRIAPDNRTPPEQIVEGETYDIHPDGDHTLYFDTLNSDGIFRVALDGKGKPKPEIISPLATVQASRKWGIWDGALYYLDFHDEDRKLRRFDLSTQKLTAVSGSLRDFAFAAPTLSVLPERHIFLYSQRDENTGSQIVELRPE